MTPDQAIPWPRFVMLELTNACDLECRHCPFHGDGVEKLRPIGHMTEATWRAAVAEIGSWGTEVVLQPWGMGEPLLHPQLWNVVRAAKRHPMIRVGFYTNGNQWRARDVRGAIQSGLDWVCFSIDGVRRDVFEHYRKGAELDRVLGAVARLSRARATTGATRPEVRINMVEYPELADHIDAALSVFREFADAVTVSRFREVGNRRFSRHDLPRIPCYQLDMMMAIASDGTVVQCCEDQQGQAPVGRFPAQSLAEIWRGPVLRERRRAHGEGRYADVPLCADCDGWSGLYELETVRNDVVERERTSGTTYRFLGTESALPT